MNGSERAEQETVAIEDISRVRLHETEDTDSCRLRDEAGADKARASDQQAVSQTRQVRGPHLLHCTAS